MNATPTRRQVASATAWSVPVLVVGAATPAVAASKLAPTLTSSTRFANANKVDADVKPYTCGDRSQLQIQQTVGPSFLKVSNITPTTKLANLAASFWFALDEGTTFSPRGR